MSWTTWTGRPAGPTARNTRSAMPWCSSWIRSVLPRSVTRASRPIPSTSSARIPPPFTKKPMSTRSHGEAHSDDDESLIIAA